RIWSASRRLCARTTGESRSGGCPPPITLHLPPAPRANLDTLVSRLYRLATCASTRSSLARMSPSSRSSSSRRRPTRAGATPRGENEWRPHPGGLKYSTELAALISSRHAFGIGAACFPEVHPEANDLAHDLRFLKRKVQSGVSFLITQLFFDNELYFRFVEEA